MSEKKILVVDDEPNMRRILSTLLTKDGYLVVDASSGEEALKHFKSKDFHAIITDLKMPGMSGLDLLSQVAAINSSIPVILITAYGTVETAVEAMRRGAYDYVLKPFDNNEIRLILRKALAVQEESSKEAVSLSLGPGDKYQIIGSSAKMKAVYETIGKVADSVATVLILGESGTGKELVARAIHYSGKRKDMPFVRVSCAALPETLLESELFGYEKGAFTGATTRKPGRFELAHRGTIFLDEVGDVSSATQAKLLRVLQEREFERLGGTDTIAVDVRVIAATSKPLEKTLEEGSFREDLFYRLNVVSIDLPPLRDRKEDIPELAGYFLNKFCKREGTGPKELDPEALRTLIQYDWPGNIRQLENVVERMVVLQEEQVLRPQHIPERIRRGEAEEPVMGPPALKGALEETTAKMEKEMIVNALTQTKGNRTKAAQLLGISRRTLQKKLKEYQL